MDLTRALLRGAAGRPRVMLAVPSGATGTRLAVEWQLRAWAWPAAVTAADTDLLVVCGRPGGAMTDAVRWVWSQIPAPKAWAGVAHEHQAAGALADAQRIVTDPAAQAAIVDRAAGGGEEDHRGHGDHHTRGDQPQHSGDGEHDGHGDMQMPGGLAMAERGPDRDGLALDQLHIALGPVLPDWPAGLLLRLTVQGDVVQHAEAEQVDADQAQSPAYWDRPWQEVADGAPVTCARAARWQVARHLDGACRLLAVAGWDGAALAGRRLRDEALAGVAGGRLVPRLRRFHRRVAGSWLLRWMTRGLGILTASEVAVFGLTPWPDHATCDVAARTRWWLDRAVQVADRLDDQQRLTDLLGTDAVVAQPPPLVEQPAALSVLARLVVGSDLAATRLIVASLDPDLDRSLVATGAGGG